MPQDRWERFFDDLEYQFTAELDAARGELAGEEERVRIARLTLRDRLAAVGPGKRIVLDDSTGHTHHLIIEAVGADWVAGLGDGGSGSTMVRIDRIEGVRLDDGDRDRSLAPVRTDPIAARTTFGFALRAFARRRIAMTVMLARGIRLDGTPSRVGADHMDLALHELDSAPRISDRRGERIVTFDAVAWVRTASRRDTGVV